MESDSQISHHTQTVPLVAVEVEILAQGDNLLYVLNILFPLLDKSLLLLYEHLDTATAALAMLILLLLLQAGRAGI